MRSEEPAVPGTLPRIPGVEVHRRLDDLRLQLACHHLRNPSMSVSEIAWLLGFQEVGAFTHASKRWTGKTPSAIRRTSKR